MPRVLTFDRDKCLACRSCELACAVVHSDSGSLLAAVKQPVPPQSRVLLRAEASGEPGRATMLLDAWRCEQCAEPLCVYSCKSGALSRDPTTGRIRLDEAECVGCWMCLMVCSHGVRPDFTQQRVVRCDVCEGRAAAACVEACPTRCLSVQAQQSERARSDFSGRLVIVGSSAAGIAAAEAARELAPRAHITLVTADRLPRYARPLLVYRLAEKISFERLCWRPDGYLQNELGVEVLAGKRAAGLCSQGHKLSLADGSSLPYDRLVIATGARGVTLDIPGGELDGVFALRALADLEGIGRFVASRRPVVVLGGGNVGLQVCEALLATGMQVTLVVRSSTVLSQMVDAAVGRRVGDLFASRGLVLRTGVDAAQILGERKVSAVKLDQGDTLPADLVVVGKGIRPNVEWLGDKAVDIGRGIRVDRQCRTSRPEVFAAGDCAETLAPLSGQWSVSGTWPMAYEMGRVAAANAVGVDGFATAGALRMNAAQFFGVPIVSIGEVRSDGLPDAFDRVLVDEPDLYRKLVFRSGRLAGALLYGDIASAGAFYRLYRKQTDLSDLPLDELAEAELESRLPSVARQQSRGGE